MKRRTVVQLGVAALAWPALLGAQPGGRSRIGILVASSETAAKPHLDAFFAGLRELGHVRGRNLVVDLRQAEGDYSRFPALVEELVGLKPDVLLGIEPAATALRSRSSTIPIVLFESGDPVASGLVQSLARPGTNVTGIVYRHGELIAKHIELLKEMRPKMSRVALLNPRVPASDPLRASTTLDRNEQFAKAAASATGLKLLVVAAGDPESVRQAFARLEAERAEGLVVAASGLTWFLRQDIIDAARRLRLPTATSLHRAFAEIGGLATYGPDAVETYRYVATYVDRILKGAKPAEMPLEQPAKFHLTLNLKTAREIGLKIPHSVLLRADRVIE